VVPVAFSQGTDPTPPPTRPDALRNCNFVSYDGGQTETCTLRVQSFDPNTPLDVDITRDASSDGARSDKVIAMLHGFGGDKREYESKTDEGDNREDYHWNSHWFAKHGYYVINYTARGFSTTENPNEPHEPATPATVRDNDVKDQTTNNKIRLKSRDFEIRDTQFLMQLVATAFPSVDPDQAAVTGLSYGGGESWVQASQRSFDLDQDVPSLQGFGLKPITIQVAVPRYTWTDLAYGLAPNGHKGDPAQNDQEERAQCSPVSDRFMGRQGSERDLYASSIGEPDDSRGDGYPIGVPKLSYIGGFFASGQQRGEYQRVPPNGPSQHTCIFSPENTIDVAAWNVRVLANDPYDVAGVEDEVIREVRQGLTEYRSSYYQDEGWKAQAKSGDKTAIFAIQGWTDDLFPAVEDFRQYKYLTKLDPRWPVEVEMADIGHPRAQNKSATWRRLNQRAFGFMSSQIRGSHETVPNVSSEPTVCANDGDPDQGSDSSSESRPPTEKAPAQHLTARTPEGLSGGFLSASFPGGTLLPGSGSGDPDGLASDPVSRLLFEQALPGPCAQSQADTWPGRYTALSAPLKDASTYVGLGKVSLPGYGLTESDGAATVNARVWDVPPGGKPTLLMTRGTYRLSDFYDERTGNLELPLFGNHWRLEPGHRVRLDLMQVDEPFLLRSKVVDTFSFAGATLTLPTREATERTVSGEKQSGSDEAPESTEPSQAVLDVLKKLEMALPPGFPGAEALTDTGTTPDAGGALPEALAGLETGRLPGGTQLPGGVSAPAAP
ncbi:MAG: hypothetical protein ACR2NV_10600, partial [Thermoleophilaceae bacterium]